MARRHPVQIARVRLMPDAQRLLNAINAAEADSYGSDQDGQLSQDRAIAIDLYQGRDLWPVEEGRSRVVDRSVFETIQWILPSLCRIFANGDDIVNLPPVGPEDEKGAKQESQYLNWLITQKNDWFNVFLEWATDALMLPNAYVLARRESRRFTELERYEKQTPEGLALLLQDGDCKVTEARQYPDPDYKPQPQVDPATGLEMPPPPPPMLHDVVIRRTQTSKAIRLYVLPPERVKVAKRTPSWKLAESDYFEWYEECTISSLRQQGFEVDDDVGGDDATIETQEDAARDRYGESEGNDERNDASMRVVKARFVWIRHDYDEDGIAEMQYCVVIGNEVVFREECSRIPVATAVTSPLPHRHPATSVTEMTGDIQAMKTTLLRQGMDNLYLSNNPQKVVVDGQVNLDDALLSRPGSLIRVQSIDAVRHETPPFVFPQVMQGMEYMDQVRENRTGTNRYFTGIDQNAMNKTAAGINQLSTMAAQRVEHIARIFASGLEDLFSIVHELILKGGHKKEVIQIRNEWVEVDPASWRRRTDFKISVGFAAGNKDAMVQRLMMLLNTQEKALAGGLSIVTEQNVYETVMELTKAADFSSPDRFWTNPQGAPPKQPQVDPIVQVEMAKIQSNERTKEMDRQAQLRMHAEDAMLEKYKVDTTTQTQLAIKGAEIDSSAEQTQRANEANERQQRLQLDTQVGIEGAKMQAAQVPQAEPVEDDGEPDAQTQIVLSAIQDMTQQLVQVLSAPRELIRDPKTGKPTGSRMRLQ
jgi:hypothetical protein